MRTRLANLRIAFLAGTLGQGGSERQLYYILKTLRLAGAQVSLLSLTQGEFWEKPINDLGVPVVWVGERQSNFARLATIIRHVRKSKVSIIQSHHFYTNPYAALAGRVLGIRDIGAIRNDALSEVKANGRIMGPICLHAPHHLVANSLRGKTNANHMGVRANKISLLPNVVDATCFRPLSRQNGSQIRLLTLGRMERQKNQGLFLSALAQLRDVCHLPVIGLVGGKGPERKNLELLARDYGLLPDGVRFLGSVADPLPLYQNADIFALTSDWEGTPNVVLEAMACGLTVVATRVGGVPEVIEDGKTGLLIEPGDREQLVEVLARLVEQPALRASLGTAARQHMLENYDLGTLRETLDNFYGTL